MQFLLYITFIIIISMYSHYLLLLILLLTQFIICLILNTLLLNHQGIPISNNPMPLYRHSLILFYLYIHLINVPSHLCHNIIMYYSLILTYSNPSPVSPPNHHNMSRSNTLSNYAHYNVMESSFLNIIRNPVITPTT